MWNGLAEGNKKVTFVTQFLKNIFSFFTIQKLKFYKEKRHIFYKPFKGRVLIFLEDEHLFLPS